MAFFCKFINNALNIITDNTCSTAGKYKVSVGIKNFERALNCSAQFVHAAEYNFFFKHV